MVSAVSREPELASLGSRRADRGSLPGGAAACGGSARCRSGRQGCRRRPVCPEQSGAPEAGSRGGRQGYSQGLGSPGCRRERGPAAGDHALSRSRSLGPVAASGRPGFLGWRGHFGTLSRGVWGDATGRVGDCPSSQCFMGSSFGCTSSTIGTTICRTSTQGMQSMRPRLLSRTEKSWLESCHENSFASCRHGSNCTATSL
jgi:hypothetical protein